MNKSFFYTKSRGSSARVFQINGITSASQPALPNQDNTGYSTPSCAIQLNIKKAEPKKIYQN